MIQEFILGMYTYKENENTSLKKYTYLILVAALEPRCGNNLSVHQQTNG